MMAGTAFLVKEIIARELDISSDKVTGSSRIIDDLGADSLDIIDVMSAVEEKFDVHIIDESDNKITTVDDLVKYVDQEIGGK